MDNTLQLPVSQPIKLSIVWRLAKALRRVILLGVDFYTLGFLFFFVSYLIGEFWYVALIGLFLQWLLLPIFVALPISLILGKWWLRHAAILLLCGFYLVTYGSLFLPNRPQVAPDGAETLKIIAFNTATSRTTPDHMKWLLEDENPDIIGLVEVGRRVRDYLQSDWSDEYPYSIYTTEGSEIKILLSKYPIESYEIFYMVTERPNIEAHLNVNGKPLTVFVVHPRSPDLDREITFFEIDPSNRPEMRMLLDRASSETPTLLLGDFNFTDLSDTYDWVRDEGFIDMHRAVGEGFGHTWVTSRRGWSLTRIDYVWVSPQFMPLETYRGELTYADHRPVIALVAWK